MEAPNASSLVGSWRLVSCEHRRADGAVELPFGPRPSGRLAYLADGRMLAMVTDPARPPAKSPQFFEADDRELAEAARGCIAYSGRWIIRGNEVIHDVELSLFPNWAGTRLVRAVQMAEGRMTLTTAPFSIRGAEFTAALIWEKEA